jgi:hypothetical protein
MQHIHNDAWSSSDGISWRLETQTRDITPRHWSSGFVHDDKIFLIGGWNPDAWPEQLGHTGEIWYTDDGKNWLQLPSETRLPARHASLSMPGLDGESVLVMAGYGHGGTSRIYNDVWRMGFHMYFPKSTGDVASLRTWGSHLDGTGTAPKSFSDPDQLFVLRNRTQFTLDDTWRVTAPSSRIVVGDGMNSRPVVAISDISADGMQRLYLHSNSTLRILQCQPRIDYRHEHSIVTNGNDRIDGTKDNCRRE